MQDFVLVVDASLGAFNNNVDKKKAEGVSRKSTGGHMTKGRYILNGM